MSDFSQGKWYVDSAGIVRCDDEYDRSIAFLITSPATKKLDEANARLIVAAPEMYGELVEAVNALRCAGVGDTRYALPKAHEIERLLKRVDGKEAQKGSEY